MGYLCASFSLPVLELDQMYATDRQTDVRQKHRLMSPTIRGGHNNFQLFLNLVCVLGTCESTGGCGARKSLQQMHIAVRQQLLLKTLI